jgi:hypothetical protein
MEPNRRLHVDTGYLVTSHSRQGQTANRVLTHVDTERICPLSHAYVAVSRGAHDVGNLQSI